MIRRRQVLRAGAAVLAAPAIVERANAQSQFDWKQFKGQSIEVNFQLSPPSCDSKRAAGATPTYSVSALAPGAICQIFSSDFFVFAGILIRRRSGSSQVAPISVLFTSSAPKCQLTGPAQMSLGSSGVYEESSGGSSSVAVWPKTTSLPR